MNDQDRDGRDGAIVEFDPIKRTIQEFRAKYGDRTFSVSDAEGFEAAKAAAKEGRKALIELEKIRKRRKERALRICQQVDAEGRQLKAGIGAIFDPIFRLVDDEESRIRREQFEAEQRERARVAKLSDRVELLTPGIPFGADSGQIRAILEALRNTPIDSTFEEFEDDAYFAKASSVDNLVAILASVELREAEAAERDAALAAERAESERLRAIVAEQERAAAVPAPLSESLPDRIAAFDPKPADAARIADIAAAAEVRDRIRAEPSFGMTPESWIPPAFCANHYDQKEAFAPFDDLANRLREQANANAAPAAPVLSDLETANANAAAFIDRIDGAPADEGFAALPKLEPRVLENDAVEICGIVYSGDFFRSMRDAPIGGWFRIVAREGGVVRCFRAPAACEMDFDVQARFPFPDDDASALAAGDGTE